MAMAWLLTVPHCPATSVVWALHMVVSLPASSLACCMGDMAVRWQGVRGDERHGDERLEHGGGGRRMVVVVVGRKGMVTQVTANVMIWVVTFERHGR